MNSHDESKLNRLLRILTEKSGLHICVHDVSGLLRLCDLSIEYRFCIHSQSFCNAAKSTQCGFKACLAAKEYSNRRVIGTMRPFEGTCPFGLLESAVPVIIDGEVKCIVYAGHFKPKGNSAKERCGFMARRCGIKPELLLSELDDCDAIENRKYLLDTANAVADYIKLLFNECKDVPVREKYHWAVISAMKYADENFRHPCTIRNMSRMCRMNEKYLGRLFSSQVGMSFGSYMNTKKLEYAAKLLKSTDMKIIDVALESGFMTVTYFNRIFVSHFDITPTEYRLSV